MAGEREGKKSEKAKSSMTRAETEIIVTDTALTLFCSLFV